MSNFQKRALSSEYPLSRSNATFLLQSHFGRITEMRGIIYVSITIVLKQEKIDHGLFWSEIISYQVTFVALPKQIFPLVFVTNYITALSFLERLLLNNREDFAFSSVNPFSSLY